jgi:hypothetical protein
MAADQVFLQHLCLLEWNHHIPELPEASRKAIDNLAFGKKNTDHSAATMYLVLGFLRDVHTTAMAGNGNHVLNLQGSAVDG